MIGVINGILFILGLTLFILVIRKEKKNEK